MDRDDVQWKHELEFLQRLRGTGIAPTVYDSFMCKDAVAVDIEKLDGTLLDAIAKRLNLGQAVQDLARSIKVMHSRGIAHADIHPGNTILQILVSRKT